jgi:hypothetical protein
MKRAQKLSPGMNEALQKIIVRQDAHRCPRLCAGLLGDLLKIRHCFLDLQIIHQTNDIRGHQLVSKGFSRYVNSAHARGCL